ncbi:MAG: hypothetical protein J3R72DRAFT_522330 [Linnemannia gamsii]|nr:MAG: hypothetical protein J3R72DRAFT_522330 [Linnemannia gamsii]
MIAAWTTFSGSDESLRRVGGSICGQVFGKLCSRSSGNATTIAVRPSTSSTMPMRLLDSSFVESHGRSDSSPLLEDSAELAGEIDDWRVVLIWTFLVEWDYFASWISEIYSMV